MIEIRSETIQDLKVKSEIAKLFPSLLINTATELKELYLITNSKLYVATWTHPTKDLDALDYVLAEIPSISKVSLNELRSVFFVSGPGSFTSLRTATSVVNTLIQELDIPVFELETYKYMALRSKNMCLSEDTTILLKAGGQQVHLCSFNNYSKIVNLKFGIEQARSVVITDLLPKQLPALLDLAKESKLELLTLKDLTPLVESLNLLSDYSTATTWPIKAKYHKNVILG